MTATATEKMDAITIVKSERYKQYRDILFCELNEGQFYSHDDMQKSLIRLCLSLLKRTLCPRPAERNRTRQPAQGASYWDA